MRAYAAHRDRLLVVGLEDQPRLTEQHLVGRRLECVAAHPSVPDRAFFGTFDDGLFVTRDGGETLDEAGDAVDETAVTALAVDHADPDTVWVGTEPSRLYRSTDGGRRFERVDGLLDVPSASEWSFPPRPDTHHVRWIEPAPDDPDRCYVGVEAGALCYTTDGGATWQDRPPGSRRDNHQLATHPDAPGRVYSAAGDGYAVSTDGGASWTSQMAGLDHRYVWNVLPDPADPERVLVSAAAGARSAHSLPGESYLYRRDGDDRWRRLECPLGGEGVLRAVLASDGEPSRAYGLTNRGLYATEDFGATWDRLEIDWPDELEDQTARGLVVVPTE